MNFFNSGEAAKIAGNILQHIGQIHWAVAALSITGYLISKCQKVSQNHTEYIELLKKMLELASHIKDLNVLIPEENEKLANALQYIVEGSMFCASQLNSGKFCSFLKSSINSDTLSGIRSKISDLYQDLNFTVNKEMLRGQPVILPLSQAEYPKDAVGIEDQLEAVNKLLNMETTEDCSSIVVLIWGFGGIGKTTLAQAVVSKIDRSRYNYARIKLDEVSENNKYKYTEMQQHILQDAFPNYEGGRKIELRDSDDGKDKLREAFSSEGNKPVFLYIDNALHKKDLEQLLPEYLGCLPQHSRILITSRTKDIVDMLEERGFHDRIEDYQVQTLSDNDAMQVLCKDHAIRDRIKDDLQNIVNVCKGIPLILTIVGAKLRKQKYDASRCSQIIEDLKEGKKIRDLSDRLFHFVYKELDEATQEAFLDICCCFNNKKRRFVEYIVGAEEVTILEEAALITPVMGQSNTWSWEEEEEERLTVHDIIRSIGRTLAKSSRIVDANAWAEAEKDEARLKRVKTVYFSGDKNYILEERHFNSMKESLRILVWRGSINVSVPYAVTLPEIRWANISGDVSWLNVEALDKLASLWCDNLPTQQRKLPNSLRSLSICTKAAATPDLLSIVPDSSLEELNLEFPLFFPVEVGDPSQPFKEEEDNTTDIFNRFLRLQDLNNLRYLTIYSCQSLCELPEQACRLPHLRKLSMTGCMRMERLPELFGQLKTLTHLDLKGCESLKELPNTFGQHKNLTYLNLAVCLSLKELPDTFGQLTKLRYLNLMGCESLKQLPDTFGQLEALQHLDIGCCSRLEELPRGIEQLTSLKYLDSSFCDVLESGICQKDGSIKIVKRNLHFCSGCNRDKKLKVQDYQ